MKRSIFGKASVIGALMASTLALSGCWMDYVGSSGGMGADSNELVGADISSETITEVALLGPDNLIVKTGTTPSITATGDEEVLKLLRFKMDGANLRIGRSDEKSSWTKGATITLTLPGLKAMKLAGSGDAEIEQISGESAELSLVGSGDMTVKSLTAKSVKGKIAGSGNMNLSGNSEAADFSIAGSGDIDGGSYKAAKVSVSIAGSGNVDIASDGQVDAKIMGSGDVNVEGSAKCTSKVMGSGDISCG